MDLNKDGNLDILSGSYDSLSRRGGEGMLGEFHVFYGKSDGSYAKSVIFENSDGEPLAIDAPMLSTICTRPYAVDLNNDGNLDIVSGNAEGDFALFWADADGKFSTKSTFLTDPEGEKLRVGKGHSDPSFLDWDGDGDLDMVSGTGDGGVNLYENIGDKNKPAFSKAITLVDASPEENIQLYSSSITRPSRATRVTVADVNQDGKMDLLVGDSVAIYSPAEGVSESNCLARLTQWNTDMAALKKSNKENGITGRARMESEFELLKQQSEFLSNEYAGFVWLYLGK